MLISVSVLSMHPCFENFSWYHILAHRSLVFTSTLRTPFRMTSGTRGQNRNADDNPPPPPDANLAQILRFLLEDRNNSRAELEASIAALQQIAQAAIKNNNNNNNNNNEEPRSK